MYNKEITDKTKILYELSYGDGWDGLLIGVKDYWYKEIENEISFTKKREVINKKEECESTTISNKSIS